MEQHVVIGVDVGGTNTDAVVVAVHDNPPHVLSSAKSPTTEDVTSGIQLAIAKAIVAANPSKDNPLIISQVNIGTTHFINAIVQRRSLVKVAVIRLCGPASRPAPPFCDIFEDDLLECIEGAVFMVDGGYEFDGRVIRDVSRQQIEECLEVCKQKGINNIVVSGIFSPVNSQQEEEVAHILLQLQPDVSVTLSSELGQLGLLERENAAILNECLKPLSKLTIDGFHEAIHGLGLNCPFYLTQNDGTIVSREVALKQPVRTFTSGTTNSMRGAAFLSGVKDAIVIDIGGTTTDAGMLQKGFPREASSEVKVGGIRTNFRMPDVVSIGLGGGSYVSLDPLNIGPQSAGYNLQKEALVFKSAEEAGQHTRHLTATDVAVAAKLCNIGDPKHVEHIKDSNLAIVRIHEMIEGAIDLIKISSENLPVILVGGGAILLDPTRPLKGASELLTPKYSDVANAVGAALSQISGAIDKVYNLMDYIDEKDLSITIANSIIAAGQHISKEQKDCLEMEDRKTFLEKARCSAIEEAKAAAVAAAVKAGAEEDSIQMVEQNETPLSYIPGNATRIQIKVVGDLVYTDEEASKSRIEEFYVPTCLTSSSKCDHEPPNVDIKQGEKQSTTSTGDRGSDPVISAAGEWILSTWDVECISIGAGILGCGGGGSPYLGNLLAKRAIKAGKKIRIVTPELLTHMAKENEKSGQKQSLVVPVGMMGAPLIVKEKLVSGETTKSLACLQNLYLAGYDNGGLPSDNSNSSNISCDNGVTYIHDYKSHEGTAVADWDKEIIALVAFEIGGLNSLEPLLIAAELGMPVLDADGMGRAFPELQMYCPLIYGAAAYPATLADADNSADVVLKADSAKAVEDYFRKVVVQMGCNAGVSMPGLRISGGDDAPSDLDNLVPYSLSQAWRLGRAVLLSRQSRTISPVEAIQDECSGILSFTGKITDVRRETTGGFNIGYVKIIGTGDAFCNKNALVEFQNENLLIRIGKSEHSDVVKSGDKNGMEVVSCVPDLITIVDNDTGVPIPTEEVRFGQRVAVLTLPSHPLLRTPLALQFVGPKAFGYEDVLFKPCGDFKEILPVGPT